MFTYPDVYIITVFPVHFIVCRCANVQCPHLQSYCLHPLNAKALLYICTHMQYRCICYLHVVVVPTSSYKMLVQDQLTNRVVVMS